MIFIYNCYGGTHTSSLASAIHLGQLPTGRVPTKQEILSTKYFNELSAKDMGKFIYRGTDSDGNKVFTLGRGTSRVVVPAVENLIRLLSDECGLQERFVLSNLSPTVTPFMTLGGYLSRALGIHFIGVPFLLLGTKQAYSRILRIVHRTREEAQKFNGNVLVLNNTDEQI